VKSNPSKTPARRGPDNDPIILCADQMATMQVRRGFFSAPERVCACTIERAAKVWTVDIYYAGNGHEHYQGHERERPTQPTLMIDPRAIRVARGINAGDRSGRVKMQVLRFGSGDWRVLISGDGVERTIEATAGLDNRRIYEAILALVERRKLNNGTTAMRPTASSAADAAAMVPATPDEAPPAVSPARRWFNQQRAKITDAS